MPYHDTHFRKEQPKKEEKAAPFPLPTPSICPFLIYLLSFFRLLSSAAAAAVVRNPSPSPHGLEHPGFLHCPHSHEVASGNLTRLC